MIGYFKSINQFKRDIMNYKKYTSRLEKELSDLHEDLKKIEKLSDGRFALLNEEMEKNEKLTKSIEEQYIIIKQLTMLNDRYIDNYVLFGNGNK